MDSIELLNDTMKRLAAKEDSEITAEGWLIKAVSVGETFLKDLLCANKHNKRIALLQKNNRQNDTSHQNGDISLESDLDESKEESKDVSSCSLLNGEDKDSHLLPVEDARNILTMYTMLHSPLVQTNNQVDPESLLPLWILCDGKDPERTSLIGCELAHTGSGQESDSSPFILTTVTSDDPISSKADVPTLQQVILEAHEDLASKYIASQGFAQFEVVSQLSADTTLAETQSSDSSYIAVECTWNQVKKILESPRDASCKVLIRAVPGDMRNTPLEVYKELCLLKTFADSLETGEVNWITREKTSSIQDLVTTFLDEIKGGPIYKRKTGDDADDLDAQLCWKAAFDRSDLDFTERLWNILRNNATCYEDITTAFSMVINELNRGQIQPMVHRSNQTTLAQELRMLYEDPAHMFSLNHSPMTHLVEIAIDKIQRDYTNFFLAKKLTTLYSLEWFVQSVDLLTPGELVKRLRSLHCILEVSMLASQSLGLPTNNILTLIRNALDYYRNNSPDVQHTFVLPVEQTSVVSLYQNQQPSVWRLTTQCGCRGDKTSSVYQLSSRPFIDSVIQTTDMAIDDEGEEQEPFHYFVTRVKRDLEPFVPVNSFETIQNGNM
ncbi:protein zwilch homolog isoform X1 [Strongylocentrotus purpuratus]|uniref:Protein zwilch n=2 Tax=Strongylocentrotus purpuratus TaxID=7668 RepID=A0A7M7MYQ6_STRPU|nr:protein zwilch homolog isoform X1 [Strongylocentrotus purpuratus]